MELLILFLLVVLNGIFAMSELAVVAARTTRLQQWADDGKAGARAALALANAPGHFLSTIQIGMSVISVASGAFAGATVAKDLGGFLAGFAPLRAHADTLALILVVTGIAAVSIVLGELMPKRIALMHPERVASVVARPLRVFLRLVFPLVKAMSLATDGLLSLAGVRGRARPPVTQEEVGVLMKQGAAAGVFDLREQVMVSRVFRMDEQRVTSIMSPRVDIRVLDLAVASEVNRDTLLRSPHWHFPLCRGGLDEIVGIVDIRGLLEDALQGRPFDPAPHAVRPLFVPDGLTIADLLAAFKQHRSHLALVVDEYGEIQGLVTMTDVMQALVGDIGTREEVTDREVVPRDDGSWLVDGAAAVSDLKEMPGLESAFPADAADGYRTLGGFAMTELKRMPRLGDKFEAGGYRFEVVDMGRHRVNRLLVTPPAASRTPPR